MSSGSEATPRTRTTPPRRTSRIASAAVPGEQPVVAISGDAGGRRRLPDERPQVVLHGGLEWISSLPWT
ncbi:MAG: hypothetical protein LCH96_07010 [Actinobacteria bacterium]|nr:hypothetical protein [Actinomycetota bacterium]